MRDPLFMCVCVCVCVVVLFRLTIHLIDNENLLFALKTFHPNLHLVVSVYRVWYKTYVDMNRI